MAYLTEERVGFGFGVLGGLLFLVGALVAFVGGTIDLVVGRPFGALDAWTETVLLVVFGGLALFFSYLGRRAGAGRTSAGVLLIVVAILGGITLGLGGNVVALVGAILVFLGGVILLLDPMKRVVAATVAA